MSQRIKSGTTDCFATKAIRHLQTDRALDRMIDDLTEAAGYERGMTSSLNLARWDLKGAIQKEIGRLRSES